MESLARRGKRGTKSKEREEREWGRGSDGDGVVGVECGGREWGATECQSGVTTCH